MVGSNPCPRRCSRRFSAAGLPCLSHGQRRRGARCRVHAGCARPIPPPPTSARLAAPGSEVQIRLEFDRWCSPASARRSSCCRPQGTAQLSGAASRQRRARHAGQRADPRRARPRGAHRPAAAVELLGEGNGAIRIESIVTDLPDFPRIGDDGTLSFRFRRRFADQRRQRRRLSRLGRHRRRISLRGTAPQRSKGERLLYPDAEQSRKRSRLMTMTRVAGSSVSRRFQTSGDIRPRSSSFQERRSPRPRHRPVRRPRRWLPP